MSNSPLIIRNMTYSFVCLTSSGNFLNVPCKCSSSSWCRNMTYNLIVFSFDAPISGEGEDLLIYNLAA